MKKNNIKTKTKVLTAGGVAIIGVGAITTGIAIGMRPQTHNPYNYTWKNIDSIQESIVTLTNRQLKENGASEQKISQEIDKIVDEINYLKNEGIKGNFSIKDIYNSIASYAYVHNYNLFDWQIVNDMVDNSLKQLQQQLLATTLPKEQQEELYSKFNNTISNKIQQLKRSGVKPNEAAKSFNDFNKLLVEEELKDEHQELIKYYLESFLSQNKLSLRKDIYIDNLNFNDINRSSLSIFSNSRGSISTTVLSNTNFDSRVLNQNAINEYFHFNSDEKDYVLSADISVNEQKSTSISKTLDVTFILNDLLHKNNSYRSNKTYSFKVLKSPSMEREETTQVINTHVFGARTIGTMMDWEPVISTIKNSVKENNIVKDNDEIKLVEPYPDHDLLLTKSLFVLDSTLISDINKNSDFLNKYQLTCNVYGWNETNNTITYDLIVQNRESIEFNNSNLDETSQRFVDVISKQTTSLELASEGFIDSMASQWETITQSKKRYSEQMLKKQEVLRDLNIALAVEQAAMAVTMGILAGIYFAASLATFGATATAGVSCTIASAACVAGCALSGVAAVQTQKEINEIKNIIEFESYDEFIEGYKQLENDEEFKLFVNSINGGTFGIKLTAPLISKYVTKLRIVQSSLNRAINRMLFAVDIGASAFRPKQILMNYLISLTEDVNEQRLWGRMRSVGEVYVLDQNNVPIECIRDLPVSNNKVNEYIEIITQASAAIGDSRPERAIMNSFDAITNEDVWWLKSVPSPWDEYVERMPKFLALEDIQKIASEGGQAQTICNNFMNDLRTHWDTIRTAAMNSRFGAAAQYGSGAVAGSAFSTVEMGRFVGGYANPAIYENWATLFDQNPQEAITKIVSEYGVGPLYTRLMYRHMSPTQRTHYILDLKSIQESLDTKFDVALARAEQFTQIRNALLEPFQFRGELDSLHYLEFASVEEAENWIKTISSTFIDRSEQLIPFTVETGRIGDTAVAIVAPDALGRNGLFRMFDVNFSAASNRLSQLLAAQPEGLRVLTDDIIHTVFTDPQINPFIQLIRDPANLVTDFEGVTHLRIPISVGTVGTGPSNAWNLSTRYITTLANIHNAVNGFEEADTVMRDTAQSFYDAYRLENNLSNSIKAFKQFHQSLAAGMYPLSALQHAAVYACPAIEIVATAVDFVASLSLTIAMFAI